MLLRASRKGGKAATSILSRGCSPCCRRYWRAEIPVIGCFPATTKPGPTSQRGWRARAERLVPRRVDKPVTMHTLRHSFATHLLKPHLQRTIQVPARPTTTWSTTTFARSRPPIGSTQARLTGFELQISEPT